MTRGGAVAGAVLLAAAGSALAQRPDARPTPPVFAVGTGVVNVTVTVLDKDGKLVTDLGPDDFSVFEDGRRQQITLFGRAHEPGQDEILALDLGLLMDTSQSMLEELRLSQEAALRFLDAVPRAHDLLTVFFAQDIQISRYSSESQQGLIQRIEEATGGGNTALYDAIAVYLSRVSDSTGRKVMVLFSDGEDTISTTTRSEVLQLVKSSGVTIYPIGFTAGLSAGTQGTLAKAFLRELAELTGGQVFNPLSSHDLPGIYATILDQLRAQYVVGFVSDNPRREGRFRRLKVKVNRKHVRVRHREGYYEAGGRR